MTRLPSIVALVVPIALGVWRAARREGDFFNSYPFLFPDSYDWILQGHYFLAQLGGADLPPLRVLRDPGFVALTGLDAATGGSGVVVLLALSLFDALAAYFLVRSIEAITHSWKLALFGVVVFLLHPLPATLRFFILADSMAVGLMAASFYFLVRWFQNQEERAFICGAIFAGASGITQKYGVLPFLVALALGSLSKQAFSKRGFRLRSLGCLLAGGPALAFLVLRQWIPHESGPRQLDLLDLSFANASFYGEVWPYAFGCLIPLAGVALCRPAAWWRDPAIRLSIGVALAFNGLAFFAQWQDARYTTYSYVSVLTAAIAAFGLTMRSWEQNQPSRSAWIGGMAIGASLTILLVQASGSPHAILSPRRSEIFAHAHSPWTRRLRHQGSDRFELAEHCPTRDGHFCAEAPPQQGRSPYEDYTWRFYWCLKAGTAPCDFE